MTNLVQKIVRLEQRLDLQRPRPVGLNVEVTNICDLRCVMCKRVERPKGYLALELLQDFLPEACALGVQQVGLFTVGESLLHPRLGDIIALCKAHGVYTYLDVNGNSLTAEKARILVQQGLDSLKFSFAAADESMYRQVHGGGSFAQVVQNLKTLRALRDEAHSPMRITAGFIILRENQHQIQQFRDLMCNVADEVTYEVVNNVANRMTPQMFARLRVDEFDVPNPRGICSIPWTRLMLTWDGYVSFCCVDYELEMNLGRYHKGNLQSLFLGETAERIRQAMLTGEYNQLPTMCRACDRLRYDTAERIKRINQRFGMS